MSQIERTTAALAGLLQPLTGARAHFTGALFGPSTGILVPKNTYAVPVIDGVDRFDLLLKTAAEVTADADGEFVELVSNLGGRAHDEIRADTPIRFLDGPAELERFGELTALLSPATDGPEAGFKYNCAAPPALASVVVYEGNNGGVPDIEFFRARVTEFPAVVIAWEQSELGDANTQAAFEYGQARVGATRMLTAEKFSFFVFSSRLESHVVRRGEMLHVLDAVTAMIMNRRSVDGQVFSSPGGLIIHERIPLKLRAQAEFQDVMGTQIRTSVTRTFGMSEYRTYNPWVLTKVDALIPVTNEPTDPEELPIVSDYKFLMPGNEGLFIQVDGANFIQVDGANFAQVG